MRMEWLNHKGGDRVILFFNGWGMDGAAVAHLETEADVVLFFDYRDPECTCFPDLSGYQQVDVVAWSMGVWAAACTVSRLGICPHRAIALNGTERPIDDSHGIPRKIYEITERGMNERGRDKFVGRMFCRREDAERYAQHPCGRGIEDVCGELALIRQQCLDTAAEMKWDRAYVSRQDMIFPPEHQQDWWQGKVPVKELESGHYPFYCFSSWEEIISF